MSDVITAISTVGFPICSFLICGAFLKYVYDKSLELFKRAFDELHQLTDAVNNNTRVLADLVEEVRGSEKH